MFELNRCETITKHLKDRATYKIHLHLSSDQAAALLYASGGDLSQAVNAIVDTILPPHSVPLERFPIPTAQKQIQEAVGQIIALLIENHPYLQDLLSMRDASASQASDTPDAKG